MHRLLPAPGRDIGTAREDERVGVLDHRPQEVPGAIGQLVRGVPADVAAPDHQRPCGAEAVHHAGGLRVVQQDDVTNRNPGRHLLDVGFQGLGHHGTLGLTQMLRRRLPRHAACCARAW